MKLFYEQVHDAMKCEARGAWLLLVIGAEGRGYYLL